MPVIEPELTKSGPVSVHLGEFLIEQACASAVIGDFLSPGIVARIPTV
jgi:hypothetical protein